MRVCRFVMHRIRFDDDIIKANNRLNVMMLQATVISRTSVNIVSYISLNVAKKWLFHEIIGPAGHDFTVDRPLFQESN